jgi:type II secretory pathway pseudopilin PulG
LIVIIIIVLLASGLVVLISGLVDRAKADKTLGTLKAITDGCNAYYADFKEFPPTNKFTGSANLHHFLGREFSYAVQTGSGISSTAGLAPTLKKHAPYIEFRKDQVYGGNTDPNNPSQLSDAWNMPLTYTVTTVSGTTVARIVSGGPDRTLGTGDDMTSDARPH